MDTVVLDIERIRMVLTMFRITQGELARASGVSTAMVSLMLVGKKRPSIRTAVALVHGLEELLTRNRRLDTGYFVRCAFAPTLGSEKPKPPSMAGA